MMYVLICINGIIRQKHQTVIIFDHDMTHAVALFFYVPFFTNSGDTYVHKNTKTHKYKLYKHINKHIL